MGTSAIIPQDVVEIKILFIRGRKVMLATNAELAQKIESLEKRHDAQFKVVFDAIRQLMVPPETKKRKIGFGREKD